MIRIVCPFCHVPLSVDELETARFDGHLCLLCPECETVLVTEAPEPELPGEVRQVLLADA